MKKANKNKMKSGCSAWTCLQSKNKDPKLVYNTYNQICAIELQCDIPCMLGKIEEPIQKR